MTSLSFDSQLSCLPAFHFFILYLTVSGVEPVVTRQTSWLESTGVCGVQQSMLQDLRELQHGLNWWYARRVTLQCFWGC